LGAPRVDFSDLLDDGEEAVIDRRDISLTLARDQRFSSSGTTPWLQSNW
jgi:hypothetical protein